MKNTVTCGTCVVIAACVLLACSESDDSVQMRATFTGETCAASAAIDESEILFIGAKETLVEDAFDLDGLSPVHDLRAEMARMIVLMDRGVEYSDDAIDVFIDADQLLDSGLFDDSQGRSPFDFEDGMRVAADYAELLEEANQSATSLPCIRDGDVAEPEPAAEPALAIGLDSEDSVDRAFELAPLGDEGPLADVDEGAIDSPTEDQDADWVGRDNSEHRRYPHGD